MASQNLIIANILDNNKMSWNLIIQKMLLGTDDISSVYINEQSDVYISGSYVFQTTIKKTEYNYKNNAFEIISVFKTNVVRFDILIENNKILLWGKKKAIPFFVTFLSISSDNTLSIEFSNIDFSKTIKSIIMYNNIDLIKMTLNNIIIEKGILANCNVSLKCLENSKELVDKYYSHISQLTVLVKGGSDNFLMRLYNTGTISIFQDREALSHDNILRIINILGGV